ncbi:MAG: FHA domain-containing protein [Chthoniobacter sp.]|nr:FHA domain-containing protein [Chthoniobacter sp.]
MPKLLVSLPDGSAAVHELVEASITIGRLAENALQIEDASVSSQHAELTLGENGDYSLTDLGSTNGTQLNGQELAEGVAHPLKAGDRVRFGHIETSYASENPAEAQAMPEPEEVAAVVASSSVRPAAFTNASPFQKKDKKKDPAAMAIFALSVVAILVFAAAAVMITGMKSPL